jgi:hypothetical protein
MFSLKKSLYYALGAFSFAVVALVIKVVLSPELLQSDLNILLTELIAFLFTVSILVNIKIKYTTKYSFTWICAIIFSALAILIWGCIINFSPTIFTDISLFPLAMITTVMSFAFTNFGIVNLAERSNFFTPFFIWITKIACLVSAFYLVVVILGWYNDKGLTVKSMLISFLILMYCDFMILLLHYLGIRKKQKHLNLIPTTTKGVYIDHAGKQYLVQEIDVPKELIE